jgi:hypothetical protein
MRLPRWHGKSGSREVGKSGSREVGKSGSREVGKSGSLIAASSYCSAISSQTFAVVLLHLEMWLADVGTDANFSTTAPCDSEKRMQNGATRRHLSTMRLSASGTGLTALAIESSPLSTGADWLKTPISLLSMKSRWLEMTTSALSRGLSRAAIGKSLSAMRVRVAAMRVFAFAKGGLPLASDPSESAKASPPFSIGAFSMTYVKFPVRAPRSLFVILSTLNCLRLSPLRYESQLN